MPAAVTTPVMRPRSRLGGRDRRRRPRASSATSHGYARRGAARGADHRARSPRRCRGARSTTATAAPSRPPVARSPGRSRCPPPVTRTVPSRAVDCRSRSWRASVRRAAITVTRMSATASEMHAVDGKVVIVTGSGKGIGKGMALHLGKGGARIVVAEWKDAAHRRDVRASSTSSASTNLGVVCDIQQHDQIDAMVAQTVERFGRVDGLINNAQTFRPLAPIAEVSERRRRRVLRLGREGHAVGDAGRVPAHEARRVGAASSTSRRRWASPAAPASRRTTRRRKPSARSTRTAAREWARRRHRRERDRAGGRDASRRGRRSRARATASSSRTAR